jgi:hypothetical protein
MNTTTINYLETHRFGSVRIHVRLGHGIDLLQVKTGKEVYVILVTHAVNNKCSNPLPKFASSGDLF